MTVTREEIRLARRLGLFTAVMVVMGNMIGSGVFKKAAPMAAELHSAGLLLLCWLIAGLVSLSGALSNAESAGMIASPGGQYAFFKRMYGRFFSFMFCWSSFTILQSASIASIAYVFGESFNALAPLPRLSPALENIQILGLFRPLENSGVKLFTVATLLLITWANYRGVTYGGLIANVSTVMKLLGIAVIVAMGLFAARQVSPEWFPDPAQTQTAPSGRFGLFGAMFTAMLGAFWAYDGWNNVISLGGEVRNPKRNIPIALALGVGGVTLIYLTVNYVYLVMVPINELAAMASSENQIVAVEALRAHFGPTAAGLVAVLILISTFGATNCQLLPPSRMYYTMAREGLFFRIAGRCHPVYRTPSNALVMQGLWSSFLVLTGTFDQLTDMVIFASFIFYGASAFGVFVLRRTMRDTHRPYRVPLVIPALFSLFCIALVFITIFERPREAFLGSLLILSGLPFYIAWRHNARHAAELEEESA
ncbi:MAG TPA: amino acid permease [Candidatus Hydrogenedentes bacterium]|nr:amino acid permease [Candidatus Hydrogenedentota bacterium]